LDAARIDFSINLRGIFGFVKSSLSNYVVILTAMKNIRFILLVIIAGIILHFCNRISEEASNSPAPEFRLAKLHYENSDGEDGVTHFYYDGRGQNYMAVWQLIDSSRSSLNSHTLDSAGRLLVKSREFSDGIRSVQHFEYNSEGKLVGEDFSRSDSVTGQVNYFYRPDGRIQAADCRGLNGWFFGKIEYIWDGDHKTGADLIRDSVTLGSIEYEYNEGRLVREQWDFNGRWSQTFRHEYQEAAIRTFTSPNVFIRESPWFRISSETYDFNGESGGPSYYSYDESGRMTRKEFIRSDGLSTVSTYEFDSTGLLDLSNRTYSDGRQTDFLYWYNIDRKLLVKTFQWSDGTSGSETYRYKDGKLILGEYVNVDGWLNGTLEFERDEKDVLTSASFAGKDGFDAELDFTYDRNFNLVKLHWEFSTGQTQTCHFQYESN